MKKNNFLSIPDYLVLLEPPFLSIIENLAEGFALLNPVNDESGSIKDFSILYVNNAILSITKLAKEDLIGKNVSGLVPGFCDGDIFKLCCESVKSNETRTLEFFNFKNSISGIEFERYFDAAITSSQNITVITFHDITEIKKKELEQLNPEHGLEKESARLSILNEENKKTPDAPFREQDDLSLLFENSFEAMFLTEPNGKIYKCNKAATKLFGFTEEEFIRLGRDGTITDFSDPEFEKALAERKSTGKFTGILQYKKKDGTILPCEVSSSIFNLNDGSYRTSTVVRDISNRLDAEKEYLQTKRLLQDIIDATPNYIFAKDVEGKFIIINRKVEELLGTTNEEIRGKTDYDFFPEERADSYREHDKRVIDTLKPEQLDEEVELPDGTHYTLLANKFPLLDEFGEPYGICGISTDITNLKEIEKSRLADLEMFYTILSSMYSGILLVNDDNIIEFANQALCDIYEFKEPPESFRGMTANEMMGKVTKAYSDPEAADKVIRKIVREGKPVKGEEIVLHGSKSIFRDFIPLNVNGKSYGRLWHHIDISELKKTEKALKESEERFLKVFLASPHAMAITKQPRGMWIDANESYLKLTGYNREELIGHTSTELKMIVEKEPGQRAKIIERLTAKGQINGIELNLRTKSGEICQVLLSAVLIKLGSESLAITQHVDITEQKKSEELLRENHGKLLEAQKLAHLGNYQINYHNFKANDYSNLENMSIEWSNEVYLIYERDPEAGNLTAAEVFSYNHPGDFTLVRETLNKVIFEKKICELEYRIITAQKNVKYVDLFIKPLLDEEDYVTAISGTVMDITSRKLFQLRLEETYSNLKDSERKLIEAQKLAHVGSFTVDLQKNSFEWSEELYSIFGLDPASNNFSFEEIFSFVHPDDLDYLKSKFRETEENKTETLEMEYRIIRKDGKLVHLHYIGRPLFDSQGKLIKRFGTITDITERKLQEIELKKTLQNLERSNNDLEQFAYIASHDLQEPLRMISNYTKLLERKYKDKLDTDANDYICYIVDGVKRMSELIHDLLSYSRLTKSSEPFVNTHLNTIIADVQKDLRIAVLETGAKLEVELMPELKCNPLQLKQLFQNLIQNAIKFRDQKNPVIKISVNRKGGDWLFSVKDNGIGISPEHYEKIFMLFQRLHTKDQYPGTGLGLAICKKIVERHEGRIWVESEPGKGTTFYFTIPV